MNDLFKEKQAVIGEIIKPTFYKKKGNKKEMNRKKNAENKIQINKLKILEKRIEKLEAEINKKIKLNSKRIQSQVTEVK